MPKMSIFWLKILIFCLLFGFMLYIFFFFRIQITDEEWERSSAALEDSDDALDALEDSDDDDGKCMSDV